VVLDTALSKDADGELAAQRAPDLLAVGFDTEQGRGATQDFIEDDYLPVAATEFIQIVYQWQQPVFIRREDKLAAFVNPQRIIAVGELIE